MAKRNCPELDAEADADARAIAIGDRLQLRCLSTREGKGQACELSRKWERLTECSKRNARIAERYQARLCALTQDDSTVFVVLANERMRKRPVAFVQSVEERDQQFKTVSFNPATADKPYDEVTSLHESFEKEEKQARRRLTNHIEQLNSKQRTAIRDWRRGVTLAHTAKKARVATSTVQGWRKQGVKQLQKELHPSDFRILLDDIQQGGAATPTLSPDTYHDVSQDSISLMEQGNFGGDIENDVTERPSAAQVIYGDGVSGVYVRSKPNRPGKDQAMRDAREAAPGTEFLRGIHVR